MPLISQLMPVPHIINDHLYNAIVTKVRNSRGSVVNILNFH